MHSSTLRSAIPVASLVIAYGIWALTILRRTMGVRLHFRFNHVAGLNTLIWLLVHRLWKAFLELAGVLLIYIVLAIVFQVVLGPIRAVHNGDIEIKDLVATAVNAVLTIVFFGFFGERLFYIKYRRLNKE
jgi:hypothetical protein